MNKSHGRGSSCHPILSAFLPTTSSLRWFHFFNAWICILNHLVYFGLRLIEFGDCCDEPIPFYFMINNVDLFSQLSILNLKCIKIPFSLDSSLCIWINDKIGILDVISLQGLWILDVTFIARTFHDFFFLLGAVGFSSILLNQMGRAKLKSDGQWTS